MPTPCLETPAQDIADDASEITMDGVQLPLATMVVASIARAVKTCGLYEHQGYGVDRSVFGVMVMGGMVYPVPDQVYRYVL